MNQTEKDALLLQILAQVPFDGWGEKAFDSADPSGAQWRRLFPRGPHDAIAHFADWADRQMEAKLAGVDLNSLRMRDRIAAMVKARLEALTPHKDAVRKEAGWLALRGPDLGPKLLWRSADRMWRLAGDTATDFNHYTKRALLSGVIASTTLCWLSDHSIDGQPTWDFLDRRIGNVMDIGRLMTKAKALKPSALMETAAAFAGKIRYRR